MFVWWGYLAHILHLNRSCLDVERECSRRIRKGEKRPNKFSLYFFAFGKQASTTTQLGQTIQQCNQSIQSHERYMWERDKFVVHTSRTMCAIYTLSTYTVDIRSEE